MPIKECQLEGKNGYKWGDAGKCYTHNNTPASKKRAKKQALEQGLAIGELAEVGPRGGIKESRKAPKSDTPNRNPEGEGSAKGTTKSTRGAEVTKEKLTKI